MYYVKYLSRPIENAHLDEGAGGDAIEALVNVHNRLPESNALHHTSQDYSGQGSKFFSKQSDGSPDWGLRECHRLAC